MLLVSSKGGRYSLRPSVLFCFSLVVVPSKYVHIFANLNNSRFLLVHFFLLFFRIAFNIDDIFLFVPIQDQVCPRLRCDRSGLYSLLSPPVR